MKVTTTFHAGTRAKWRAWLKANRKRKHEIWLVYDKGERRRLSYAEAVEEALCFGWIDGIVKPIDDDQYAQRFTPRKNTSNWSAVNRRRFEAMEEAGLMTDAGRDVGPQHATALAKRWREGDALPADIDRGLKGVARKHFNALPRSYREQYVRYITEAKQPETRKRRLVTVAGKLARNEHLYG